MKITRVTIIVALFGLFLGLQAQSSNLSETERNDPSYEWGTEVHNWIKNQDKK